MPRTDTCKICGKPIEGRSDKEFCSNTCRYNNWIVVKAESDRMEKAQAEHDRIQKRDHVNNMQALDFLEKNPKALTYLRDQCDERLKLNLPIRFRRYLDDLRDMGFIVRNAWERWIKEYVVFTYSRFEGKIPIKKARHESQN
jgi:hypothetical protein